MKCLHSLAWLAAIAALSFSSTAQAQRADYELMVSTHAAANGVPADLVHRVIVRESKYRPGVVGRGGTIGLMQIKLATARGMGYTGDAAGLRDPNTNLTYAVKYLAGAYRAAGGDHNRAVGYYAGGYYHAAKRQRSAEPVLASAPTLTGTPMLTGGRHEQANRVEGFWGNPADARAEQVPTPRVRAKRHRTR